MARHSVNICLLYDTELDFSEVGSGDGNEA